MSGIKQVGISDKNGELHRKLEFIIKNMPSKNGAWQKMTMSRAIRQLVEEKYYELKAKPVDK